MTVSTSALTACLSFLMACAAAACGHGAGEPAEPTAGPLSPSTPTPDLTENVSAPSATAGTPASPGTPPSASSAGPAASVRPDQVASPAAGNPGKPKPAPSGHPTEDKAAPAASAVAPPATEAPAADACATKNFHYSQVGAACSSGGRKAAKDVMKGVVKKAKAAGTDLKCTSCHVDVSGFQLKGNAVTDLKQWL
jgi:hypothetical protein